MEYKQVTIIILHPYNTRQKISTACKQTQNFLKLKLIETSNMYQMEASSKIALHDFQQKKLKIDKATKANN